MAGDDIMSKPMISEDDFKLEISLERIKHVIIIMSGKGGVGKSTVATNIAAALSTMGYQTGIMDVDITGPNIPKMFGIEDGKLDVFDGKLVPVTVPPSLKIISMAFLLTSKDDAVMWRGPVKMTAIRQFIEDVSWGDLDYLIVDMPPGTGDEAISIAQLIPKADGMVIVTTPQDVALLDSRKSITFSAQSHIPIIGLIENMCGFVCPHCGKTTDIFKSGGGVKTAKDLNIRFLGSIPVEPGIVVSSDSGMPIVIDNPNSTSAKMFKKITEEIIKIVT